MHRGWAGEKLSAAEMLNRHCLGKAEMPCEPVCLCTTNREAQVINAVARAKLKDKSTKFDALVTGKFPEGDYPTEALLELAPGARVMMLCNRRLPDGEFEFVNGDMGVVEAVSPSETARPWVRVELDRGTVATVQAYEWKNYSYELEEDQISGKKILRQKEIGKFVQIPVRLAYAITIHKSQGLTFDAVDLKLGSGCFTHGQLYTALSRCRSLAGLRIDRRVMKEDLILDGSVVAFYKRLGGKREESPPVMLRVPPEFEKAMRDYLAKLQAESGTEERREERTVSGEKRGRGGEAAANGSPDGAERVESHPDIEKLLIVYGNQTGKEKSEGATMRENGIGFNKCDASVLSSIAEDFESQGWISRDQLREVSRRIRKYHAQWES